MVMKNKLYLHHKNKIGLWMKDFSIVLGSFTFAIAALVVPTYISIMDDNNVATKAEQEKDEEKTEEEDQDTLLTYDED